MKGAISGAPKGGALEGLRILDLTLMLSGPYGTMLLADQGADVIKVEPPTGDVTRPMGPFKTSREHETFGGYFASINRGKRSMVIDLKKEEGKSLLKRLVKEADVLVENFRSGVMERLGLSYETLADINPKLVYATIRGFGDKRLGESPYETWPAYDVVSQAMGGIMGITGPGPENPQPIKIGPGVGDIFPGALNAFGILAAVYHAQRTGQGQFLDVSMTDSVLSLCERIVYQYSYQNIIPGPEGNAHPMLCPFGLFPVKDGWVTIGCPSDHFWVILTEKMGVPELGTDNRYALNASRSERRTEVNNMVSEWTRQQTKSELAEQLGTLVPFGPVNNIEDIFNDEHFKIRNMLVEVEQPGANTPVTIAGSAISTSKTESGVRGRGPLLGEHTVEVLREFNLTNEEILTYRKNGAIN